MKIKYALIYGVIATVLFFDILFIKQAIDVAQFLVSVHLDGLGFAILFWSITCILIQPLAGMLIVWTIKE